MSTDMNDMTIEQKADLASLQLNSLEVSKTPVSDYDVAIKSYVDAQVLAADSRVTDILAGSQPAFDTLVELKALLDAGDGSLATSLTNQIASVNASIAAEVASRNTSDTTLQSNISTNVLNIAGESTARQLAVNGLQSSIDNNNTFISDNTGAITQEVSDRTTAVSDEAKSRDDADVLVRSDMGFLINEESSTRTSEVSALDSSKLDKSTRYETDTDGHFKVKGDAFLYIGDFWRIRANADANSKRLEFEYSPDGATANFSTAVPFVKRL